MNNINNYIDIIGYIGGFCLTFNLIPQYIKLLNLRDQKILV